MNQRCVEGIRNAVDEGAGAVGPADLQRHDLRRVEAEERAAAQAEAALIEARAGLVIAENGVTQAESNVAASIAAIDSVESPVVLIAGGEGKGGDFSPLKSALENKLRAAVLIGTDAREIANAIDPVGPRLFASDMDDAVEQASRCAEPGDVVLLAPACASFDQFQNYMARGDAFAEAVRRVAS